MNAFDEPRYLQTTRQDVLSACKSGLAFLRSLNLGPRTAACLDGVMTDAAFARIEAAGTDSELAAAMASTRLNAGFRPFTPLFRHYAASELAASGEGMASRMYSDMSALALFHKRSFGSSTPVAPEVDAHLAQLRSAGAASSDLADRLDRDPIARYGVVMTASDSYLGLKEKFEAMAKKPRSLGEIEGVCAGSVTEKNPMGIVFEGTRRAAEYIAAQLPDNAVHRYNGARIVPARVPEPQAS